jgi:phosphatidylglycerophosphate synthase
MRSADPNPGLREFRAANRGGGLYSEAVSQPAGAAIALAAQRIGASPAVLSLANAGVGLLVSTAIIALAGPAARGAVPGWWLGLVALFGWQLAYAFDCADGQLARVTGRAGPAGARLDVLCDLVAQIALVTALSAVALAYRPGTPAWLPAVFAGTWLVNLIASVLQSGPAGGSLVPSTSSAVRAVKLGRDYGAVSFAAGVVLLLVPRWTVLFVWSFTILNGLFLLVSTVAAARQRS